MTQWEIWIPGTPKPKPRQTKRDRRRVSPEYLKWCGDVQEAYIRTVGLKQVRCPVSLEFVFYLVGHPRVDISNLIKAVEDALVPTAFDDDDVKHIPELRGRVDFVCDSCDERPVITRGSRKGQVKATCSSTQSCKKTGTRLTIRQLTSPNDRVR